MNAQDTDTIVAIATAPGRGGVGIIRISGQDLSGFCKGILRFDPEPRKAHFSNFFDQFHMPLDQGIALFFPGPGSFTGEDVLELQAHGGPVVLDMLLMRCVELGARLARSGEFSERAFLNDKIDLAQAEAIADLIEASSVQAAQGALRSLQGVFSEKIHSLVEDIITLRIYVEAAIDFPEEEVDFLRDGRIADNLAALIKQLHMILDQARQGALIQEGMTIVLAGKPNAGKSSLLNALSGRDSAIVTAIAGTTRDILREQINIDGLPLNIIDTAGLRRSNDEIEQEGIRRAMKEIEKADRILYVIDSTKPFSLSVDEIRLELQEISTKFDVLEKPITFIINKADITGVTQAEFLQTNDAIVISTKNQMGIDLLIQHLKNCVSYQSAGEGLFTARSRHIDALKQAYDQLLMGQEQLEKNTAGELLAEDLRIAQRFLSTITGEFTADDLLGKIFSSFCIGK